MIVILSVGHSPKPKDPVHLENICKMRKILIFIISALIALPVFAQVDKRDVRRGNRDFKKANYKEAEIDYRKALVKDSTSLAANYNLASVLYKNEDYQGAAASMKHIEETAPASGHAADYYFNVGDIALAQKDYSAAVEAFKSSLLLSPDDLKAKENYIYAKKMLENQQNQQNQDNQNQDNEEQNNDQNQDQDQNQNNDQNQDKDQNKDQQNDQNQDKQNGQGQQNQQPQISPQAAQQMLQAIQEKEKATQEKVKKEKAAVLKSKQKEKNW